MLLAEVERQRPVKALTLMLEEVGWAMQVTDRNFASLPSSFIYPRH